MAKLITTREAAERLGVTPSRIRAMIAAGRLRAQKFGRDHQIKEGDLLQIELERDPDNPHQPGRPRKETNGK